MYISAFLSCSRVKASVYNAFPPRVNSKPSSTVMWKVWVVKISSWIYLTVQPSLFLCLLTEMDNYVTTSSCLQFSLPYSILQRVVNLNLWLSNFTFLIGLFNVVPDLSTSSVSQTSLKLLTIFTTSNSMWNMFISLFIVTIFMVFCKQDDLFHQLS